MLVYFLALSHREHKELVSNLQWKAFTETSESVLASVVDELKLPFRLADWQVGISHFNHLQLPFLLGFLCQCLDQWHRLDCHYPHGIGQDLGGVFVCPGSPEAACWAQEHGDCWSVDIIMGCC